LLQIGCAPLIPAEQFLAAASFVAFRPELTCEELKIAFGVPELTTVDDPGGIDLAFEEAFVETDDGVALRVWYVPAEDERGLVLLANGAVGELPCYLLLTRELHALGWSMVMYDYRGHGASGGSPSLTALYPDFQAVLTWTREHLAVDRVAVLGISLGTLPAIAGAVAEPEVINAVVLDGVVSLHDELRQFWFLIGNRVDEYAALLGAELQSDVLLPQVTQPLLGVVYGLDEWTPPSQARQLLSLPANTETLEFPLLPHARGPYRATSEYFARLDEFLAQVWGN
jgi:pimeloyl-ACP methyl ester carboxylesterase